MEIKSIVNGVTILPETDFEQSYLKWLFTNNHNRKVVFNHDTGNLRVTVEISNKIDTEIENSTKAAIDYANSLDWPDKEK